MDLLRSLLELNWVSMFQATLNSATPIVLAAMAGIICERSGVVNIALEGIMLTAAYVAFAVGVATGSTSLGLIAACVAGMLVAGLHALLSIRYKTDQVISGTVMNIFALGITTYLYRQLNVMQIVDTNKVVSTFPQWNVPVLSSIPVIGEILFTQQPIVYATLIGLFVMQYLIYRTKWGLRMRAVGEFPRAADTAGINVNRLRYVNVILSGLLAGIGGAWLVVEAVGSFNPNMTAGRGFIGLAAMIFGSWNPIGALLAALLFTIPGAVQVKLQLIGVPIPYQFLSMLPYIMTIVVLAGAVRRARPPAALGKPYG